MRKQKYILIFIEANDIHVCGGEGGGILRVMMVIINYDMDNRGADRLLPGKSCNSERDPVEYSTRYTVSKRSAVVGALRTECFEF